MGWLPIIWLTAALVVVLCWRTVNHKDYHGWLFVPFFLALVLVAVMTLILAFIGGWYCLT